MSHGGFREADVAEAVRLADEGFQVIDVREPSEWDAGHVVGATLLPLDEVASRITELVPDRATPALLPCAVGARSARAASWLVQLGYTNVVNLKGQITEWASRGGRWEEPAAQLTPAQQRRYARQVLIPEIGEAGQRKLIDARVLLIGA